MKNKIIGSILVMMLIVSLMTGCGQKEANVENEVQKIEEIEEEEEMSIKELADKLSDEEGMVKEWLEELEAEIEEEVALLETNVGGDEELLKEDIKVAYDEIRETIEEEFVNDIDGAKKLVQESEEKMKKLFE